MVQAERPDRRERRSRLPCSSPGQPAGRRSSRQHMQNGQPSGRCTPARRVAATTSTSPTGRVGSRSPLVCLPRSPPSLSRPSTNGTHVLLIPSRVLARYVHVLSYSPFPLMRASIGTENIPCFTMAGLLLMIDGGGASMS